MRARSIYALLLLLIVFAACQTKSLLQEEGKQATVQKTSVTPTGISTATPTSTLTPEPTSTPVPPTPTVDSSTEPPGPMVWFCPNFDGAAPNYVPPEDSGDIFLSNSLPELAQEGLDVFKFYIGNLYDDSFPLNEAVKTLNQSKIAIAIEAGGLRDWDCSGRNLALEEMQAFRRIKEAGGTVEYIALDSPFAHTLKNGMPNACNFTLEEASYQLAAYIRTVRSYFPDVKIGIIEPVPWYTVQEFQNNNDVNYGDLIELLDTSLTILDKRGQEITFFHADSPYEYNLYLSRGQGWSKMRKLQEIAQSRGLRFGLIFNSERGGGISDQRFFEETLLSWQNHVNTGQIPDDIILQSWYWYPREWLPMDKPYTYTNLLLTILQSELLGPPVDTDTSDTIIPD